MLPLVAALVLGLLQVATVIRDGIALTAAARAAARRAVVDPDPVAVTAAARGETGLDPRRLDVRVAAAPGGGGGGGADGGGTLLVVTASYRSPTDVPVVGALVEDQLLVERFTVMGEAFHTRSPPSGR